ncbi:MAG: hypothetical protein WA996_17560 [Candidatus Promineifilaceae bacterium]
MSREVQKLNATILESQVNAALSGYDIGPFESVERGYQAVCRTCGKSIWVGDSGVMYSLLGERCGTPALPASSTPSIGNTGIRYGDQSARRMMISFGESAISLVFT